MYDRETDLQLDRVTGAERGQAGEKRRVFAIPSSLSSFRIAFSLLLTCKNIIRLLK